MPSPFTPNPAFLHRIPRLGLAFSVTRTAPRTVEICIEASNSLPEDPVDWLLHLSFLPVLHRPTGAIFHMGFLLRAQALLSYLQDHKLLADSDLILIYGHSLGGGVAIILHILLVLFFKASETPSKLIGTVAAGAPKPIYYFPKHKANLLVGIENLVHGNDVVTKLPPFLRQVGFLRFSGPARRWYKLSFKDHFPSNYDAAYEEFYS